MRRTLLVLPFIGVLLAIAGVSTIPEELPLAHVFMGTRAAPTAVPPGGSKKSAHKEPSGHSHGDGHAHEKEGHDHGAEGAIEMSPAKIEESRITIGDAAEGMLERRLTVPGVVIPDSARIARVPAQVAGTVAAMNKRLGDAVAKDEVVAIISSREVADAKSEYLAAAVNLDLQKTLFERAQTLWDKRVSAEQQYLQARTSFTQAELRLDLARQKLSSLGLDAQHVAAAAKEDSVSTGPSRLRTYEVKAPIGGRVIERKVDVGAPVGREGDASELYVIADLSTIWVELAVPTGDLDNIQEGRQVIIQNGAKTAEGKIVFISPVINPDTRSARVIAGFDNAQLGLRLGSFVMARVTIDERPVGVRIPRAAVQTIEGKSVVFVRTEAGFEKREVEVGQQDEDAVEIVFGLFTGEKLAVTNTFLLKAELGKSEAEHSH